MCLYAGPGSSRVEIMGSRSENPERLLSAALRAQAAGGSAPEPQAPPPAPRPERPEQPKLPVGQVLLFAMLLGLAAGSILGVLSVL